MNYFLGIDATTGTLVADFEDTADTAATTRSPARPSSPSNVWHHAAATYDGTTWSLYLDGALDRTLAWAAAFTPAATASSTPASAPR